MSIHNRCFDSYQLSVKNWIQSNQGDELDLALTHGQIVSNELVGEALTVLIELKKPSIFTHLVNYEKNLSKNDQLATNLFLHLLQKADFSSQNSFFYKAIDYITETYLKVRNFNVIEEQPILSDFISRFLECDTQVKKDDDLKQKYNLLITNLIKKFDLLLAIKGPNNLPNLLIKALNIKNFDIAEAILNSCKITLSEPNDFFKTIKFTIESAVLHKKEKESIIKMLKTKINSSLNFEGTGQDTCGALLIAGAQVSTQLMGELLQIGYFQTVRKSFLSEIKQIGYKTTFIDLANPIDFSYEENTISSNDYRTLFIASLSMLDHFSHHKDLLQSIKSLKKRICIKQDKIQKFANLNFTMESFCREMEIFHQKIFECSTKFKNIIFRKEMNEKDYTTQIVFIKSQLNQALHDLNLSFFMINKDLPDFYLEAFSLFLTGDKMLKFMNLLNFQDKIIEENYDNKLSLITEEILSGVRRLNTFYVCDKICRSKSLFLEGLFHLHAIAFKANSKYFEYNADMAFAMETLAEGINILELMCYEEDGIKNEMTFIRQVFIDAFNKVADLTFQEKMSIEKYKNYVFLSWTLLMKIEEMSQDINKKNDVIFTKKANISRLKLQKKSLKEEINKTKPLFIQKQQEIAQIFKTDRYLTTDAEKINNIHVIMQERGKLGAVHFPMFLTSEDGDFLSFKL